MAKDLNEKDIGTPYFDYKNSFFYSDFPIKIVIKLIVKKEAVKKEDYSSDTFRYTFQCPICKSIWMAFNAPNIEDWKNHIISCLLGNRIIFDIQEKKNDE